MTETSRLPPRASQAWDWQLRAACRNEGGIYFFHPSHERGMKKARREARAKAICRTCPVLAQCRRYALAAREPDGIWGGLSREDRDLHIVKGE
jgi:WhiB family redox-sensing transcriptional regulator